MLNPQICLSFWILSAGSSHIGGQTGHATRNRLVEYQTKCRSEGKNLREGRHSVTLAPLIAALPSSQRVLGMHVSAEHHQTRSTVTEHATAESNRVLEVVTAELYAVSTAEAPQAALMSGTGGDGCHVGQQDSVPHAQGTQRGL